MKVWLAAFLLAWAVLVNADDKLFLTASKVEAFYPALDDLHAAIMNNGYVHLKTQPIDDGLRQKGYAPVGEYRLVFLGKAADTRKALEIDPDLALVLPLKIIIYKDGERVRAYAPSMQMWKEMFPAPPLQAILDGWQQDLQEILKDFAQE